MLAHRLWHSHPLFARQVIHLVGMKTKWSQRAYARAHSRHQPRFRWIARGVHEGIVIIWIKFRRKRVGIRNRMIVGRIIHEIAHVHVEVVTVNQRNWSIWTPNRIRRNRRRRKPTISKIGCPWRVWMCDGFTGFNFFLRVGNNFHRIVIVKFFFLLGFLQNFLIFSKFFHELQDMTIE